MPRQPQFPPPYWTPARQNSWWNAQSAQSLACPCIPHMLSAQSRSRRVCAAGLTGTHRTDAPSMTLNKIVPTRPNTFQVDLMWLRRGGLLGRRKQHALDHDQNPTPPPSNPPGYPPSPASHRATAQREPPDVLDQVQDPTLLPPSPLQGSLLQVTGPRHSARTKCT